MRRLKDLLKRFRRDESERESSKKMSEFHGWLRLVWVKTSRLGQPGRVGTCGEG